MTPPSAPTPRIPVSWGELIDKITVLEIKCERILAKDAAQNVKKELDVLRGIAEPVFGTSNIAALKSRLAAVNSELWDIENCLREKESKGDFDRAFIELARSVYTKNDARAALKKEINGLLKSELVEEKSYAANPSGRRE
jgi:Family of unknown function (DUF6165)